MQEPPGLESTQIDVGTNPNATMIWLHGLGANGRDLESLAHEIGRSQTRFLFPNAPVRAVTINGGAPMRAWYDLLGIGLWAMEDEAGIHQITGRIHDLIQGERERGIAPGRIVLAGFSQGGALALHAALNARETVAGVVALSTYLPLHKTTNAPGRARAPLSIFMAHGDFDPVIQLELASLSMIQLRAAGHRVDWHTYSMGHSIISEEIRALRTWLATVLP